MGQITHYRIMGLDSTEVDMLLSDPTLLLFNVGDAVS